MKNNTTLLSLLVAAVFAITSIASFVGCGFASPEVVITFDANGGELYLDNQVVTKGSKIILPEPEYSGYIFTGWFSSSGKSVGSVGDSFMANLNEVLYAQWRLGGWYDDWDNFQYNPETSLYYVNYEIQYLVNDYVFNTYYAKAFFDSFAAAWAFAQTGGPYPVPHIEREFTESINKWYAEMEDSAYEVIVYDEHDEGFYLYTGGNGFWWPATYIPKPYEEVSANGYVGFIIGVNGPVLTERYEYEMDPGFIPSDGPVVVEVSEWTVTYSGWIEGIPDIKAIRYVPIDGIIYDCR
ncbi:MAG: InlB B-repeat-containing protein [Dehalococcoidia bacterium]|nr:InlB B-repeat-containing protein [Dehalococcoidia bacterium]